MSRIARCLVVQHVPPESAYAIGDAMVAQGIAVDVCRMFAGDRVPASVEGIDGLVVMGGPMSASEDTDFPSRRAELALLAAAVDAEIPTLGVCLGAQLLALATDGRVYPGAAGPEIGWAPVTFAPMRRRTRCSPVCPRRWRSSTGTATPLTSRGAPPCWLRAIGIRTRRSGWDRRRGGSSSTSR